jgi:hypothetical protein
MSARFSLVLLGAGKTTTMLAAQLHAALNGG